jgi:DNA-binding Lrp family transcriptional regulator
MPKSSPLKSRELDEKDKKIFMLLQEDARIQLKKISEKVGISIDSVHNRIKEMKKKEILFLKATLEPRKIGLNLVSDNKIRLKNADKEQKEELIKYLVKHPYCTDLHEIMGQYDLTCVIMSPNSEILSEIINEIRFKFKDIIDEWVSVLVLKTHKFDEYTL